jgi:site-specific recombinase XerD
MTIRPDASQQCRPMDSLSLPTVNVRLSAIRKMVSEARKNGMLGAEEAANPTGVPNIPQKGTRLGNWLTREQARELLAVPDRSTLKGKRDYASWPCWSAAPG